MVSILAQSLACLVAAPAALAAPPDVSPPRQLYYERELTEADLAGRTLRELSLMRNWIYARHGHPIQRRWLRELFESLDWYEPRAPVEPHELPPTDRRNAEAIARADYSIPRSALVRMREKLEARESLAPEQEIEMQLLEERLGVARTGSTAHSPLRDAAQLDRPLTVEQLADFSRRDLELLRHLIHARRGKPFDEELLRLWFQRFDWYAADPGYTEERLTDVDRRNVRFLHELEEEVGGPLSEENPDWLSAA